MEPQINRQFRLKQRPHGRVKDGDFDFVAAPMPVLGEGDALVRVLYLSIDPTQRVWMDDFDQYMPPVAIGEVMRGGGIGRVVESRSGNWRVGDLVRGLFGWQEYCCIPASADRRTRFLRVPEEPALPIPAMLGVCGITGLAAYFGLIELALPKAGETLVVSAAAGAVGSVAGQIARIMGCRAVGIARGQEKCRWLSDELGFDAAIDCTSPGWKEALAAATPGGIDIDFENVGGAVMEAVVARMNIGSRMSLCGLISQYNEGGRMPGDFSPILMKRIRVQGFIVTDFLARFEKATARLATWVAEGRLKHRETVVQGLQNAPAALNRLFDGDKIGKLMVKVSDG